MKHKIILIKSAKARATGTIPYCHGKDPHSRKLLSLCSNDFKGVFGKILSSKGHNSHKI
jgi:hypothetical protein